MSSSKLFIFGASSLSFLLKSSISSCLTDFLFFLWENRQIFCKTFSKSFVESQFEIIELFEFGGCTNSWLALFKSAIPFAVL